MLRKLLDSQIQYFKNSRFKRFLPLIEATDNFCYEPLINTSSAPFIRDAVDVKRWMMIVIFALFPAILMAIWNTGLQKIIYTSNNYILMEEFLSASYSFKSYFHFIHKHQLFFPILLQGLYIFLPLLAVSYIIGGICEIIFSTIRQHPIAEGLLVTGMLYPLILPPTIPLWMAALGIAFGIIFGKELFGGTGMNILNPALTARAFLFFTFPNKITGDVWVGSNSQKVFNSLSKMNSDLNIPFGSIDGFSQATCLQTLNNASDNVKKIHVEAIASNLFHSSPSHSKILNHQLQVWEQYHNSVISLENASPFELQNFITSPINEGGLGLSINDFDSAYRIVDTIYGYHKFTNGNLFWGNILGCLGETSTIACLSGAFFLILTGVGSWRTMLSFGLGAFIVAWMFKFFSTLGFDNGAWAPARYFVPAYRHLLMGGLAFGLVYMATDPVSSPTMKISRWIYGFFIGSLTIVIRLINPAYPEGVMLAILFGNVLSPLIDYFLIKNYRRHKLRESK